MDMHNHSDKIHILAMDDSAVMREALSQILSSDYELTLVKNHADFREMLEPSEPHIILLDLNIPDGNGIDICRTLRLDNRYEETAIIIITGSNDMETIEDGYSAGADDFIRKPIIPYELKAKIQLFEKSIRHKSQLVKAYTTQVELNKKLNMFQQIVQDNISTRDLESSFRTAEELSEIINAGYIEIIKISGSERQSILSKSYNESGRYRSFEELNKILQVTERIRDKTETMKIKSGDSSLHCLVIPLLLNRKIFGYILIENNTPFSEEDLRIIALFSNFFTIIHNRFSIENEIEKMNNEYKAEISKVRKIQVSMLPDFSTIRGYDISAAYIPAQDISGDFFDSNYIDEDTYQIIICDISGHGIASSYIGNQIRTLFKTASHEMDSPSAIVKAVNDAIATDLQGLYYYATAVVIQIQLKEGIIRYVNAGHPPILLYKKNEQKEHRLMQTGPLIGLFEDNEYREEEIRLEENDTILLYTDGVTEAGSDRIEAGNDAEMFGDDRLMEGFVENQGLSSRDIIQSIIGQVYEFTDYSEQSDDVTIICIRKDKSVGDILIF